MDLNKMKINLPGFQKTMWSNTQNHALSAQIRMGMAHQEWKDPQISNTVNAFALDNAVEAFDKVHLTLSFSMNEY